ncbi:carbohydrate esterase family 9 protein [Trametes coccinea BRFM310]|uniref:Carbohydrate esterase family 9 protein n=1 Tax=Trametes coccinea (strain BRFM310) TaxID=1353009 RepID=A0A1Y2IYF4_TRAC3|nr:carbohydrate esterase family 9 protein [Trametes coccinea BRFM310]
MYGVPNAPTAPGQPPRRRLLRFVLAAVLSVALVQYLRFYVHLSHEYDGGAKVPLRAQEYLDKCHLLTVKPGPPPDFHTRTHSDRFVPGTPPTLITNATIWTGRGNGLEVVHGDILLHGGIIRRVGHLQRSMLDEFGDLARIDAQGRWISPGIVDLHSHIGVGSSPELDGADDSNSFKAPVQPWLRALDALNTHDDSYATSIAGGTSLVLPGSADAIGGQGIVIKLRRPTDRSPTGMLLENPYETNRTVYDPAVSFRYRQMKHACGENPDGIYGFTRMDTAWAFREAYEKARKIKQTQDEYCAKAVRGEWAGLGEFPEDLQWEALVDVLRGRVKVQNHCYETIDLDDMVRLTNEFKFSIAAFHHAHETYLVPDTLKKAYGHPPAIALFATNARYKRESYRGSEFAPKILADNGLQVVMKSDHSVLNSRFLLYEAQQAYYYGLPHNLALAAVTSTPARIMGQDHRIGYVSEGYDADIVLWDSHPLALGATPQQVWIDGIPQIEMPYTSTKPQSFQKLPRTPNFDKEATETLKYDGLPPLEPKRVTSDTVVFLNVSAVYLREEQSIRPAFFSDTANPLSAGVVVVRAGKVECMGSAITSACASIIEDGRVDAQVINLEGGAIAPGLVSVGSSLGLEEITSEKTTIDGYVLDPLSKDVPVIVGGTGMVIRAADGLRFGTRDALYAYRYGVTTGVVAPQGSGFLSGLNTAFSTAASHKLEDGALLQEVGGLHVSIHPKGKPSVSTQIAALRHILLGETTGELKHWVSKIKEQGEAPLVIAVESADIIASLISLKAEVEHRLHRTIQMTLIGATEAHLLAKELGQANIGVVVSPTRPFPEEWEKRRIMPGPPLSETNAIAILQAHNVTVGVGVVEPWMARNTRLDIAWAALESNGQIEKADALALASVNVEKLLGIKTDSLQGDMVATLGGDLLDFGSKVVGVISPRRGLVDIF